MTSIIRTFSSVCILAGIAAVSSQIQAGPSAGDAAKDSGVAFHYVETREDWNKALEMARAANKPVFVDAFTTWCPPCKALDRYVFSEASVGSILNKDFVALKIDLEKGFGVDFADTYNIQALPTLLVLDPEGKETQRWVGFRQAPQLIDELKPFRG